jgi:hypothetical protein
MISLYVRLWEQWPANNIILFDGHCITGPQIGVLCTTYTMIFVPLIYYYSYVRDFTCSTTPGVCALVDLDAALAIILLMLVSCTDPGILPRREVGEAMWSDLDPPEREGLVDPFAGAQAVDFCTTCNIHRPSRASHCRVCDNCVLRFDHHCVMLNTCIGARNYTFFLLLVGDLCVLAVLMSMSFFAYSAGTTEPNQSTVIISVGTMVLALAILFIFMLLTVLCGYHVYLVMLGSTTRENLKGRDQLSRRTTLVDLIRRDPSRFNLRETVVAFGSRRPPNATEEMYDPS